MSPRRRSDSPREPLDDRGRPIHERIRKRRTERGLAAAELARRAGISPAYVTRIEKGEKVPSEEVALKIARILGDDPELYLWWVHGRFISDPTSTLEGFRKSATPESHRGAPPAAAGFPTDALGEGRTRSEHHRRRAERNRDHMEHEIHRQEELLRNLSQQHERLEEEVDRQRRTLERITSGEKEATARPALARSSRRFDLRMRKVVREATRSEPVESDVPETIPEDAEITRAFAADLLGTMAGEPTTGPAYSPDGGSVPTRVRLHDNADPARSAPEWLWLDPALLPEEIDASRVVAHRLSAEDAVHLGDLDAGDVVVVARGFDDPPDPGRIYLVAAPPADTEEVVPPSTRLSRVRVKGDRGDRGDRGDQLILISAGVTPDVEIIDLSRRRGLEHWLLGKVVLVIRRVVNRPDPA